MRRIALITATLIAVAALPATAAGATPAAPSGVNQPSATAHPTLVCDLMPFLPGCGLPNFPF